MNKSKNTKGGKITDGKISAKSVKLIIIVAAMIVVASLWAWCHFIYNGEDSVFWGMIGNNLSTTAFTQKTTQDDGMQRVEQITEVQTSPKQLLNSTSTLTQGTTKVVTQTVGTPTEDDVRYTNIQSDQKNAEGKPIDFSKVLNIWGNTPSADPSVTSGQNYGQSILAIFPFGSLTASQRNDLINRMKNNNVYSFSLSKAEHKGFMGRTTYTYDVKVKIYEYVTVIKQFAKDVGLNQLDSVSAESYKQSQPLDIVIKVDAWSRQLTQVSYNGGARVDDYLAFGSQKKLEQPPVKTVPVIELQQRLQSVQ
jgi:hypothetical protein